MSKTSSSHVKTTSSCLSPPHLHGYNFFCPALSLLCRVKLHLPPPSCFVAPPPPPLWLPVINDRSPRFVQATVMESTYSHIHTSQPASCVLQLPLLSPCEYCMPMVCILHYNGVCISCKKSTVAVWTRNQNISPSIIWLNNLLLVDQRWLDIGDWYGEAFVSRVL